jgi:2-polyprenyl-6-methoxyphenol hydroxylase-like FAD-dependent oxidoreductase
VLQPWFVNRVELIGDAVHATTPHLASGACIGIEDGVVVADELCRAKTVTQVTGFSVTAGNAVAWSLKTQFAWRDRDDWRGQAEHSRIMGESMMAREPI